MNYLSASATCGKAVRTAATPAPSRVSAGRNRSTRMKTHVPGGVQPSESRQVLLQNRQWETIHEMFFASRSRFVGLAYSILRNHEDAEDAVQNAILSAYLHLRSFEGRSAFTTWFTRIVFNAALMIRRKRKRSLIDLLPDFSTAEDIPRTERIPTRQPDPERAYAKAETLGLIDELLAKINPVLRQAFTMAYYEELSVAEAGSLLGVTATTFKSRVFRARQQLVRETRRALMAPIRNGTRTRFSAGRNSHAFESTGVCR